MTNDQVTQVQKLVNDLVIHQITDMIEEMSSHDFIERVMVMIEEEGIKLDFDSMDTFEEVKDIVGDKVIPLIIEMTDLILQEE